MMEIIINYFKRIKGLLFDSSLYLLSSLIPMVLSVAINPLLAINLSPSDYAIIGYISSFTSLACPLILFFQKRYYFKSYFSKTKEENNKIKSEIIKGLILFSFMMGIFVIICISIYHYYFNTGSKIHLYPYVLISISTIWLMGLFNFKLGELRIEGNSRSYFKHSVSKGTLYVLILLINVVIFKGKALGYLFSQLIISILTFIYCFYVYRKFIFTSIDLNLYNKIFRFCWPIALAGVLDFFTEGYNSVVLERIGNTVEYGYYVVGSQMANYIGVFSLALFSTFTPDIYKNVADKKWNKLIKIFIMLVVVQLLVVSVFIVISPFVIKILTAGRYVGSISYARILSISQIFIIMYYFINDLTIALGATKIVLISKIITSALSIFIVIYIINRWSFIGAAYSKSVTYFCFVIINVVLIIAYYKFKKAKNK